MVMMVPLFGRRPIVRSEARRCAAAPVGAAGPGAGLQVKTDHLGQELAELAVPLQAELDIRPGGVGVIGAVLADVVIVLDHR